MLGPLRREILHHVLLGLAAVHEADADRAAVDPLLADDAYCTHPSAGHALRALLAAQVPGEDPIKAHLFRLHLLRLLLAAVGSCGSNLFLAQPDRLVRYVHRTDHVRPLVVTHVP